VQLKTYLKKILPKPVYYTLNILRNWQDILACISFLESRSLNTSFRNKWKIVKQIYRISFNVDSPHQQEEILNFIAAILSLPSNSTDVLVEAGCYKGSSTAKFSLAAEIVGRELVVFDSFQGIPQNMEPHDRNIFGEEASFKQGDYCGTLDEVRANVSRFGAIGRCRFVCGWFEDTMPEFEEPISLIYLDVDLASSTCTCIKYLFPLLRPGGILFSQDGHLPLVIDALNDDEFWLREVGCKKPSIVGLGHQKLIKIVKDADKVQ